MIDVSATFKKYEEDEYLKDSRITEDSVTRRPDIRAFLLLDKLLPDTRDIISDARHDEIFLDVDLEQLALVATDEDILYLVRCGVRLDEDSLCMFV